MIVKISDTPRYQKHNGGMGFSGSSDGEESICNAGDLGSIPRSERSPREGKGNPFQYSCLENATDRGAWQATVHGTARVGHGLALSFFLYRNRQGSTVTVCPSSHLDSLQLPVSIVYESIA